MADRIVLCRFDLAEIGAPKNYCAKPVVSQELCADHFSRRPY